MFSTGYMMVQVARLGQEAATVFADSLTRCSPGARLQLSRIALYMRLHQSPGQRVYCLTHFTATFTVV